MTESEIARSKKLLREAQDLLERGRGDKIAAILKPLVPDVVDAVQTQGAETKEIIGRTRFFISCAKEYSVRLSALLLLVAAHTQRKFSAGRRGKDLIWHKPAEWYAKKLGVNRWQVYDLVAQAKEAGLVEACRTGRGVCLRLKDVGLYNELLRHREDRRTLGFYHLKLAGALGLNGSIIYSFLKEEDEETDERRIVSPQRVALALPWISPRQARDHLEQLWQRGAIQRERSEFRCNMGQVGYRYFWQTRKVDDRLKWQAFSNRILFIGRNKPSAENTNSVRKTPTRCGKYQL